MTMAEILNKVDVVTIGVGWTGGIVAAELSKQGHKVVGLERGGDRNTSDFSLKYDELRYALRYELMQDLSRETLTFRNNIKQRALPMRQYGSFLLGNGVGGAGVHWNGLLDRFLPYDFEIKSKTIDKYGKKKIPSDVPVQDWGITYDEMEPYYDQFEKMAGISGEETPNRGPRSNDFPTGPMKSTPMLDLFKETTKKMGLDPFQSPSANTSERYENPDGIVKNPCQYNGFCERFGCEYGAKASPIITVIPTAQKTGNFELRTNSEVIEILHKGGKATGVKYVDTLTGIEYEQPADVVVLTSYTFNNSRLLLLSKLGTPYDPKTQKGVIGKNYCYQIDVGTTGFFNDKKFNVYMGSGALAATLDNYNGDNFDHTDLDFIHGGSITVAQSAARPINNNNVPPGTPSWGKEFKKQSIKYFNRSFGLYSEGASLPHIHNYLDLDPTYKDVYGRPLIRLTYDYSDSDRNRGHFLSEKIREIVKEMGADFLSEPDELDHYDIRPYQATHNTGGVIMGDDPATSAVNSYLQMWDADNVFVVGGSAYPHHSGYNATGTMGALAYRASEGIMNYFKKGGQLV